MQTFTFLQQCTNNNNKKNTFTLEFSFKIIAGIMKFFIVCEMHVMTSYVDVNDQVNNFSLLNYKLKKKNKYQTCHFSNRCFWLLVIVMSEAQIFQNWFFSNLLKPQIKFQTKEGIYMRRGQNTIEHVFSTPNNFRLWRECN